MKPESNNINNLANPLSNLTKNPLVRILRYLFRRIFSILLTIVIGVFFTVIIANHGGMVDRIARERIDRQLIYIGYENDSPVDLDTMRRELEEAEGLTLSFWPKHLLYTYKALTLNLGDVWDQRKFHMYIQTSAGEVSTLNSRDIILSRLPNTMLLSGSAYLLLILIGIPVALHLSQREGKWLDKLIGFLTPISSVPSWVLGVLLVVIFAVELKLFPAGSMYGLMPPVSRWETIKTVAYHLVLPVIAIVLSLVFQLIFNWRTFLLIYSDEDYVTLAKSMGLKKRTIESKYILRPVLPYMLTSFAMTLVGFWQTITALEFFFQWPGIGKLYVDALPNFHGEAMYRGEMSLVIGIVVLFAYILGITVLLLEFLYILVDPRIRIESQEQTTYKNLRKAANSRPHLLKRLFSKQHAQLSQSLERTQPTKTRLSQPKRHTEPLAIRFSIATLKQTLVNFRADFQLTLAEIYRSPGSYLGLVMVLYLILISIAVVIFIPYKTVGREWTTIKLTENPTKAKLAQPHWINWFRKDPLPETIILDSRNGSAVKQFNRATPEMPLVSIDFAFDYPYTEFPGEIGLYIQAKYIEKSPFLSFTWITPDGREFRLKNSAVTRSMTYNFDENIASRREVQANEHWKKWFVTSGNYPTPAYYVLFANPVADEPEIIPGKYTLRLQGTLFEQDSDLDAKMVIFGLVEGWGGTDNMRRDLIVPVLWGLPFALLIGVLGSVITTLASLFIAAASAWRGGWVDELIQRAIEANLIIPIMAIGVLLYAYYFFNLWLVLGLIILLNVLGSPTKAFRAAFLQVKEAGFIEAARAYGASNWRIISRYMIPRILPVVIPQIITLIPSLVFLEATLAIFNISDPRYPTWGRVIYSALRYGAAYGSRFWVLEPIALMLLTGLAFVMLGFTLNRLLNPHLHDV
ncbi:MAG: hypothetical protein CVU39_15110 [Chloroflexi bacterium HGW-Chloroflexi-10]|nr:MAG: hypothetical protein CVU39_15110 [Chloroflexi bacterium HGW-Chloroflexi-10]